MLSAVTAKADLSTKYLVNGSRLLQCALIDNLWPHLLHEQHKRIQRLFYVHSSWQSFSIRWRLGRTGRLLNRWWLGLWVFWRATKWKPHHLATETKTICNWPQQKNSKRLAKINFWNPISICFGKITNGSKFNFNTFQKNYKWIKIQFQYVSEKLWVKFFVQLQSDPHKSQIMQFIE